MISNGVRFDGMRPKREALRTVALVALLVLLPAAGQAADVVVLCSNGYRAVLQDLVPEFQRSTGMTVVPAYDLSANLVRRIESGEQFDLAVLTPALVSELELKGLVKRGTAVNVAVTPIGIAIRSGSERPDLQSVDAVRRTLLGAPSIGYAREGAAAGFFLGLIARLGLADTLKKAIVPLPSGAAVGGAVAEGAVRLGIIPVSEILPLPGIAVGGIFPPELGGTVTMTAGVGGSSTQSEVARALTAFLAGAAALPVLQQHGMSRPDR
jgi:molybdate transport system substrate-binding protein